MASSGKSYKFENGGVLNPFVQLFVIAAVQPSNLSSKKLSRPKLLARNDRRVQPSLNARCHPSLAGSSSTTGDCSRTTPLGTQPYPQPPDHATNDNNPQNGNRHFPHPGMVADARGKRPAQSDKHCSSGRDTVRKSSAGEGVNCADGGKPWVWIVEGVARSGIGSVSAPASEHWSSEDDPDWTPPPDSWAPTPRETSPDSHAQSTATSPATSYHADGEDTETHADESCTKTTADLVADPPRDIVDGGKGTSVLPSRSSLTDILANRPPGYKPRIFYPKSQAQQYLFQTTSLQHAQHIDRSSRAPHIRPPPRLEPYQERLRAHLTSHRSTLARRQPPPAPRKNPLSEYRHRSIPVPAYQPSGSTSSPAAVADDESCSFFASHRHDTALAYQPSSGASSPDAEVDGRACLQSTRPENWVERCGRITAWKATLPQPQPRQARELSSAPSTCSWVNRPDDPIDSTESTEAWLAAQREFQHTPEPLPENDGM